MKIGFCSGFDARGKGRAGRKRFSSPMTGRTPGPETRGRRAGRENSVVALGHAELEAFTKGTRESSSRPWKRAGVQERVRTKDINWESSLQSR